MNISGTLTDEAILGEIGQRLARQRLELRLTQATLAEQAGVSKRTVERIEAGGSAQMSSLIRLLRTLKLAPRLNALIPEAGPGPLDLLELKGTPRRRVRSRRPVVQEGGWTWGDER